MSMADGRVAAWMRVVCLLVLGWLMGEGLGGRRVGHSLAVLGAFIGLTVTWLFDRLSPREQRLFDGFITFLGCAYLFIFLIIPAVREYWPW